MALSITPEPEFVRTVEDPAALRAMPRFVRFTVGATALSEVVGALALLAMCAIICYEIVSRFVFNAPTSWVTEIATYLLVAMTFLGLAAAQRAGAHISVELLLNALSSGRRDRLLRVANWLCLYASLFCLWQIATFNYREQVNGTRDWGLLSTPQWIPQLPVTIGFLLFTLALLAEAFRLEMRVSGRAPEPGRLRIAQAALGLLVVALAMLGPLPVRIGATSFDWGSVAISVAFAVVVFALSGIRAGLAVVGSLVALGAAFALARGAPLGVVATVMTIAIGLALLGGLSIAFALGIVGLFGLYFLLPSPQLSLLAERAWSSINSFTLTAVPMFVLMSALLLKSGVSTRMFDSLVCWFGRTPGGLAHASVGASAMFAAVSGSSMATAAALGRVACPDMIARGYSARLTYGVTAAGATLGIMIPPSIAMIIYGSTVGVPVNVLFVAGIVPGLLLAFAFMVTAFVWALAVPGSAPAGDAYPIGRKLRSVGDVLPFATVIVAVLGSLFMGIATPTEAAAIGVAMSLALCVAFRRFSWRMAYDTAVETVTVTAFILLIVVGAAILSWVFDYLRLPHTLVSLVKGADVPAWLVLVLISIIYLVLGMFVESISMILMTIPVTFPIVTALGFDPIWFGIYLVIMVEVGLITPPVGMVLFVLRGVSGDVPLRDIAYGAMPFVMILFAFVVLMACFPGLISWLPRLLEAS